MIGSSKQSGAGNISAPMSEINTTPLVDVMLVLLVIFIITAPMLTHAVKIDLPQASSQPAPVKPEIISIAIDSAGNFYWNDAALANEDIKNRLIETASRNPQVEVQLRADKDTRYETIAQVMATAQNAGIQKLGFVSVPDKN